MTCLTQPVKVPGQFFADDSVGLAPPLDNLHAVFAHFSQWADECYIVFGVKKCGVMALGRHSDAVSLCEQATPWQLVGELNLDI
jgi:hypothetical protein